MIDKAFDAVGITDTARQAVDLLDRNGRLVVVGISGQDLNLGPFASFALARKRVVGHLGYQIQDIAMLVELVASGRLDLSESVSAVVPLSEIHRGIEMLEQRVGGPIRILVQP